MSTTHYVVRGTGGEEHAPITVYSFRFHAVLPRFTFVPSREEGERYPDMGTMRFGTLAEAAEAYRNMGHLRDVTILAVAEDGTEAPLQSYEQALTELQAVHKVLAVTPGETACGAAKRLEIENRLLRIGFAAASAQVDRLQRRERVLLNGSRAEVDRIQNALGLVGLRSVRWCVAEIERLRSDREELQRLRASALK